jgi:formylglycine-generating enzyme required for sulfatase activity
MEPESGRRVALADLAARYGHCEVWLVADGSSLFSAFTGRMERWLDMFQMWPTRLLLTPVDAAGWGDRERRLTDFGFQIIPATPRGLARIIDHAAVGEPALDWYPSLLQSQPYSWIVQESPGSLDVARLCTELRLYLGAAGFRWLSASAVYPVIEWPLTLYLGESLTQPGSLEPTLRKLVRLPWFRRGVMPDWLRAALIRKMDKPFRRRVRDLLESLLSLPPAPAGPDNLKRTALEVVLRRERTRGIEEDEVLLAFLWGTEPTGLVQPVSALRRLLFNRGRVWLGLRPAISFLVAAALSAGTWWAMGLHPPVIPQQILANVALDVAVSQFHDPVYFAANYSPSKSGQFPMWCYDVAALVLGLPNPYSPSPTFSGGQPKVGEISQTGPAIGIVADARDALVFQRGKVVPSKLSTSSLYAVVPTTAQGAALPELPVAPSTVVGSGPALDKTTLTVRENPRDGLKYVWIPSGDFMMGCSPGDSECNPEERPAHQVTITKGFWMGQTVVTVGAYKRFAGTTGRQMPAAPDFNTGWVNENMPIVSVTWEDAQAYCGWLGGRLPTEAEWEYAARGGSTEGRYGNLDEIAWYNQNSGGQMHEVAQKRANGFGLYDMLGNVWEWVNDCYDWNYYRNSPSQDPSGPASGQLRVLRGGSWLSFPRSVRVSDRDRGLPGGRDNGLGFRCGGEVFAP